MQGNHGLQGKNPLTSTGFDTMQRNGAIEQQTQVIRLASMSSMEH
jgi:hypothetical protein